MHNDSQDREEVEHLTDLLFDTSMSLSEICKELGWNINKLNKEIKRPFASAYVKINIKNKLKMFSI